MTLSRARSARRFASFAGLLVMLVASEARAAPPPGPSDTEGLSFHDGARSVTVTRTVSASSRGKLQLSPVTLRYEGRSREINAFVDHTAVVDLEPGAEAQLEARGARLVKPLMPSI